MYDLTVILLTSTGYLLSNRSTNESILLSSCFFYCSFHLYEIPEWIIIFNTYSKKHRKPEKMWVIVSLHLSILFNGLFVTEWVKLTLFRVTYTVECLEALKLQYFYVSQGYLEEYRNQSRSYIVSDSINYLEEIAL